MIAKELPIRQRIHDYLYNLEAMTRKEAKHLWRQSIKDAWCNCCAYCGTPPIDDASLTLDHVKPRAKGGEDKTSNCIPACKRCNHSKGSEDWVEWFRRQDCYSIEREYRIRYWIETEVFDMPFSGDIYHCEQFVTNV
jgi:hypothetical protein